MSTENERKGIQLSDNELDGAAGGNSEFIKDGYRYYCDMNCQYFDSLFNVLPPNGCMFFTLEDLSKLQHCCANCAHKKRVQVDGGLLTLGNANMSFGH